MNNTTIWYNIVFLINNIVWILFDIVRNTSYNINYNIVHVMYNNVSYCCIVRIVTMLQNQYILYDIVTNIVTDWIADARMMYQY